MFLFYPFRIQSLESFRVGLFVSILSATGKRLKIGTVGHMPTKYIPLTKEYNTSAYKFPWLNEAKLN